MYEGIGRVDKRASENRRYDAGGYFLSTLVMRKIRGLWGR